VLRLVARKNFLVKLFIWWLLVNEDSLVSFNRVLKHFIDNCLGLDSIKNSVNGFHLVEPLLSAAAYNTYIETVSDKSDTIYLRCKYGLTEMVTYSYIESIKRLSRKFCWNGKEVVLAFDYTEEDFYGDVQGLDIHGWKCEKGVTGKFKFLTCSIVSDEIPEKIPLISVPIQMGHYKSHTIIYCLNLIKNYIGEIKLILFDRGFYDKDLMYELSNNKFPYLIFVPKQKDKKEILYPMAKGEQLAIIHNFDVNKDKSKFKGETFLSFLKEFYDPKSEKNYDRVFATNVEEITLTNLIKIYKKRWRIETAFRVQDEARIKCKSKDMKIRYFLFMFQQMLQTQWVCFFKNEVSFKEFLITNNNLAKKLTLKPKKDYKGSQRDHRA
jgi:hypothetical protein